MEGVLSMMIYRTRYLARKAAKSDEVVVKVCGGFMLMEARAYRIWKSQK